MEVSCSIKTIQDDQQAQADGRQPVGLISSPTNTMNPTYAKARRHLSRSDPLFKALIAQVGPCTLQTNPDRFCVLARSIVSQQISGKAANSISNRLAETLGKKGIHAKGI